MGPSNGNNTVPEPVMIAAVPKHQRTFHGMYSRIVAYILLDFRAK
jgi:hypothetical protein